jgi:hypothetical protein
VSSTSQPSSILDWSIDVRRGEPREQNFYFTADAGQLEALRDYLDVLTVTAFSASGKAVPLAEDRFRVSGRYHAQLVQASVVSLEPVPEHLDEAFDLQFWPAEMLQRGSDGDYGVSLDEEAPEAVDDGYLRLGSVLTQLVALAIEPYPRLQGERFETGGEGGETKSSPFDVLRSVTGKADERN